MLNVSSMTTDNGPKEGVAGKAGADTTVNVDVCMNVPTQGAGVLEAPTHTIFPAPVSCVPVTVMCTELNVAVRSGAIKGSNENVCVQAGAAGPNVRVCAGVKKMAAEADPAIPKEATPNAIPPAISSCLG